jgi:hypothetical protein
LIYAPVERPKFGDNDFVDVVRFTLFAGLVSARLGQGILFWWSNAEREIQEKGI